MGRLLLGKVVFRDLHTGDQQNAVPRHRPFGLPLEGLHVARKVLLRDRLVQPLGPRADRAVAVVDMVGDGNDVESRLPVDVDRFRQIDRSVRPGGVDVEVAQQHRHGWEYNGGGLRENEARVKWMLKVSGSGRSPPTFFSASPTGRTRRRLRWGCAPACRSPRGTARTGASTLRAIRSCPSGTTRNIPGGRSHPGSAGGRPEDGPS